MQKACLTCAANGEGASDMCRVDVMTVCEAGVYSLRTGAGPLSVDPGCGSSHCELLTQDNIATLVVVSLSCMHSLSGFQSSKHVVCAGEGKLRGDTLLPVALWPVLLMPSLSI